MAEAKSENLILTPASAQQEITLRLIFGRPTSTGQGTSRTGASCLLSSRHSIKNNLVSLEQSHLVFKWRNRKRLYGGHWVRKANGKNTAPILCAVERHAPTLQI
jgi:hypothetical protein